MAKMYTTAVVGAGMIGSSAAKWAAEMSPDGGVVLVGGGEEGLYRAWSDEGRITRVFDLNPNWRELAAESIKRYRTIEEESGIPFFHEVGYLTLVDSSYANPKKLTDTAEVLNTSGYTCKEVAGKEGAQNFPYLELLPGVYGFTQPDRAGHLSPRALVAAQQKLAGMRGCQLLREAVVGLERAEEGHFVLHLSSGKSIESQRVILSTGAYLNLSNHLKPFISREVNLRLTTQTVAYLRISEDEASRLADMPSLTTNYASGLLDGTYILPPIRYPDGRIYLKLGHGDHFETDVNTVEELDAWYKDGKGNPEAVESLATFIKTLIPELKVEEVTGGCCVTSKTPTKDAPYIDEVSPGLFVAAGGCGYAAKSCDEIGRVAASLAVRGKWDSKVPQVACKIIYRSGSE